MNYLNVLLEPNKYKELFINGLILCLSDNLNTLEQVDFAKRNDRLQLNCTQKALIDKVEHIIFNKYDFRGAFNMLDSFKNGVKNLKTSPYECLHNEQYEYKEVNGNEKLSHKGNLKKAHFRWNNNTRYTLSNKDIYNINIYLESLIQN